MKLKALLFLSLISLLAKAQSHIVETVFNKGLHDKIYFVEFGDRQVLELIRSHDNKITGTLTNAVWKLDGIKSKGDIVKQVVSLPENDARALFADLQQHGFDIIPDGDCQGVDGETTNFITQTEDHVNDAAYWGLDSSYCQKDGPVFEKIQKARTLTADIGKYIDIKAAFKAFTNSLPKGKYTYGMIILEKKGGLLTK